MLTKMLLICSSLKKIWRQKSEVVDIVQEVIQTNVEGKTYRTADLISSTNQWQNRVRIDEGSKKTTILHQKELKLNQK